MYGCKNRVPSGLLSFTLIFVTYIEPNRSVKQHQSSVAYSLASYSVILTERA